MKLTRTLVESAKKNKAAQLRAQLKHAEQDLKDMNVTPHSEQAADAIDDARADVAKIKKELANLGEGVGYTADEAYQRHIKEVQAKLQRLSQEVQSRASGRRAGDVNWGPVGDIAHISELLSDALEFMTGDTE